MVNPVDLEVAYQEHARRVAWINEHGWKFEKRGAKRSVRAAVARMLMALAGALDPAQREARAA